MRNFLFCMLLLAAQHCWSQSTSPKPEFGMASASGIITVPTLQSINISLSGPQLVEFTRGDELDKGKLYPNFALVTAISNVPYLVSVMAGSNTFTATNGVNMPVSVISLKGNVGNGFIPLSANAQTIIASTSNQIRSVYNVDAQFSPGWTYPGGQYNTVLTFTLTAQ